MKWGCALASASVWLPGLRVIVGAYLMGLSAVALPIFIPLDQYIGEQDRYDAYLDRMSWSKFLVPVNIMLMIGGYNHMKHYNWGTPRKAAVTLLVGGLGLLWA